LKESLFFAELITVEPQSLGEDLIISLAQIKAKIKTRPQALIIRTLPNAADKKTKQYSNTSPPYLLAEIGSYLAEIGVKHLLIDLPSVDRESDGGVLAMHHAFWQLPHQIRKDCTITELIYVSDEVQDGIYVLNLQTAHFELDAVPSKPVLYKVLSQKY
jgi:kynurenine formamidase